LKKLPIVKSRILVGVFQIGSLLFQSKKYAAAKVYFEKALTKEITTLLSKQEVEEYLRTIKKKHMIPAIENNLFPK